MVRTRRTFAGQRTFVLIGNTIRFVLRGNLFPVKLEVIKGSNHRNHLLSGFCLKNLVTIVTQTRGMRQMNVAQMCASCIHEGYCIGAYKKDHWCGNHIDKGAINCEHDQYRNGSIGQYSRDYKYNDSGRYQRSSG